MSQPVERDYGTEIYEDDLARRMNSGAGRKLASNLIAAGWKWTYRDGASWSGCETTSADPDPH